MSKALAREAFLHHQFIEHLGKPRLSNFVSCLLCEVGNMA